MKTSVKDSRWRLWLKLTCVSQAAEQPLQYATVHQDIRRVVAHRFPYSVYFRLETQRIVVLAVFHSRRNPEDWLGRTKW